VGASKVIGKGVGEAVGVVGIGLADGVAESVDGTEDVGVSGVAVTGSRVGVPVAAWVGETSTEAGEGLKAPSREQPARRMARSRDGIDRVRKQLEDRLGGIGRCQA
jgi:hypothetical protein